MNRSKYLLLIIISILSSCAKKVESTSSGPFAFEEMKYTKLFGIAKYDSFSQLFYINKNDTVWSVKSSDFPKSKIRIATLSSVFAGFLETLDQRKAIVAIDKIDYFNDSLILNAFSKNEIIEIGEEGQLKMEKLLLLKPDFLIGSSHTYGDVALINRLKSVGTEVLVCDNFKEQHPLARAEWIKFFGFITGQYDTADSIFNAIVKRYDSIKMNVKKPVKPLLVMTDALYMDSWNIPGANSYTAQLIHDAGANYVFDDKKDRYTYPLNFETVYKKAADADIWIHVNQFKSLNEMLESDNRYDLFKSFRNKSVFNYNKRENSSGGNDFWETGVVRPDIVLNDLTIIVGGDKNKIKDLYFYTLLD